MANPTILPAAWASAVPFTVAGSSWAALDLTLSNLDTSAAQLILTVPAGAAVLAVRAPANWSAAGAPLLTGGAWTAATVLGDWSLTVTAGAATTDPATLSISSATSGAGGRLRLVVSGLTGTVTADPAGGDLSIDRVLATPTVLNPQVTAPPLPVREHDNVAFSASVSHTSVSNPAPTLALSAPPAIVSAWSADPTNTVALPSFVPGGASANFTAPPVYVSTALKFSLKAALDLNGNAAADVGEPFTADALTITVEVAKYGMVLVLDRSGSMSSSLGGGMSKWQASVQAAHAWSDLFRAFRPGGSHLAGVVTFENDSCGWTLSGADDVTFRNPASGASVSGPTPLAALSGFGDVTTWNVGTEQSCTPIGDGLVKAWTAIGAQLVSGNRGAVVLMTDGYENSGAITIAASKGAASATFASTRESGGLTAANAMIGNRLYTLALGTQVDDDRLNTLGSGYYRQITESVAEVTPAFAEMLGHSLHAEQVMPQGPMATDPDSPANALYYRVSTGERVLAFLSHWTNTTDSLRIGHRPQGSTGPFTLIGPGPDVTVTKRATHGLTRVDLTALFGAGSPAKEWRLQHVDAGSTPQPNLVNRALVMVDLVTKVDVGFARPQYYVGEPIVLEVRIATGGLPVTGATVLVDSARPGEGLGTYLTQNAQRYLGLHGDIPRAKVDPAKGKGLMVQTLFQMNGISELPIIRDTGLPLLDDGAHDDGAAGDGLYANRYADTAKEGTYTFRFRVTGALADGSEFSRVFVRSTWVGLRPDPAQLNPIWTLLTTDGQVPQQSRLIITPMYGTDYLGPFRADAITVKVWGGQLNGSLLDLGDGRYELTILHDTDKTPTVSIDVFGQPMMPTAPGGTAGGGGAGGSGQPPLGKDCWRLWHRALCCTWVAIRKLLTGK